jgi:hypothetical protein
MDGLTDVELMGRHVGDRMVLLHRLADSVTVVTGAVVGLGARSPAGALGS